MAKRVRTNLKSFLIRGSCILVIGCVALSMTGLPLPTGVKKDLSVPFPCQDRACGCMSAADCKAHCCCFSKEQKRKWAESKGLDPATLVDEVSVTKTSATEVNDVACSEDNVCPYCERRETDKTPIVANSDDLKQSVDEDDHELILVWQARRCRGEGSSFLAGFVLVPPPKPMIFYSPFDRGRPFQVAPFLVPESPALPTDSPVPWC